MNLKLQDKRVLITGGGGGIGRAIATLFLEEGARVICIARHLESCEKFLAKLDTAFVAKTLIFAMDCAEAEAWKFVITSIQQVWGGLDIVIANVGNGVGTQEALPNAEHFAVSWRNNFLVAEETARATLPLLENSENGSLLFISSIAGLEAIGAPTDYSVAKSALIALTKQIARRLAPKIRVNCLAPGNVYFQGGSWEKKLRMNEAAVREVIESTVPMRRFGIPEEIANVAVFLSSSQASFVTGACWVVDGGQTVGIL